MFVVWIVFVFHQLNVYISWVSGDQQLFSSHLFVESSVLIFLQSSLKCAVLRSQFLLFILHSIDPVSYRWFLLFSCLPQFSVYIMASLSRWKVYEKKRSQQTLFKLISLTVHLQRSFNVNLTKETQRFSICLSVRSKKYKMFFPESDYSHKNRVTYVNRNGKRPVRHANCEDTIKLQKCKILAKNAIANN